MNGMWSSIVVQEKKTPIFVSIRCEIELTTEKYFAFARLFCSAIDSSASTVAKSPAALSAREPID